MRTFFIGVCFLSCFLAQGQVAGGLTHDSFSLYYNGVGWGSNFGSIMPVFRVTGNQFVYTKEKTSFWKDQKLPDPILVCKGSLRKSSVDSILSVLTTIRDSVIWKWNSGIMSGAGNNIYINTGLREVTFNLRNASDPDAWKIIDILNSNLPKGVEKLWLVDWDK